MPASTRIWKIIEIQFGRENNKQAPVESWVPVAIFKSQEGAMAYIRRVYGTTPAQVKRYCFKNNIKNVVTQQSLVGSDLTGLTEYDGIQIDPVGTIAPEDKGTPVERSNAITKVRVTTN
jgi:hypothetical protein